MREAASRECSVRGEGGLTHEVGESEGQDDDRAQVGSGDGHDDRVGGDNSVESSVDGALDELSGLGVFLLVLVPFSLHLVLHHLRLVGVLDHLDVLLVERLARVVDRSGE